MSSRFQQLDKAAYERAHKQYMQSTERIPQIKKPAQSSAPPTISAASGSQLTPLPSRLREDFDARTVDLSSLLASPAPRRAIAAAQPQQPRAVTSNGFLVPQNAVSGPRRPRASVDPWVGVYTTGSDFESKTLDARSAVPTPAPMLMQLRPEAPVVRSPARVPDPRAQLQTASQPRRGSLDTAQPRMPAYRPPISLDAYYAAAAEKQRRRASSDAPKPSQTGYSMGYAHRAIEPELITHSRLEPAIPSGRSHSRSRSETPAPVTTAGVRPTASDGNLGVVGVKKATNALAVAPRPRAPLPGQWTAEARYVTDKQRLKAPDSNARPALTGAATVPQAALPQAKPVLGAYPQPTKVAQAQPMTFSISATRAPFNASKPLSNTPAQHAAVTTVQSTELQRPRHPPRRASEDGRDASRARDMEGWRNDVAAAQPEREHKASRDASRERDRSKSSHNRATSRERDHDKATKTREKDRARDRDRDKEKASRPRRHSADRQHSSLWLRDSFNPLTLPPGDMPLTTDVFPPRPYKDKQRSGPPPASRGYPADISKEISQSHSRQRLQSQAAAPAPLAAPTPMRAVVPSGMRAPAYHRAAPQSAAAPVTTFAGASRLKEEFDAKTLHPDAWSIASPRSASAPPDRPGSAAGAAGNKLRKRPPLKLKLSDGTAAPTSPPLLSPTSPTSAEGDSSRGTLPRRLGLLPRWLGGRALQKD